MYLSSDELIQVHMKVSSSRDVFCTCLCPIQKDHGVDKLTQSLCELVAVLLQAKQGPRSE